MRNFKSPIISILLFILLFAFLIYADRALVQLCQDVSSYCIEIEKLLEIEDENIAYEKAVELLHVLKEDGNIAPVYVNHQDYDALINEALRLSLYIKGKDHSEALASLHILRYGANNMKNLQKTNLSNIF